MHSGIGGDTMLEKAFLDLTRLDGILGGVLFSRRGEILLMQLPSVFSFDAVLEAVSLGVQALSTAEATGAVTEITLHYEVGRIHLRRIGPYGAIVVAIGTMDRDVVEIGFNVVAACLRQKSES